MSTELRPLSLGELLDRTFTYYREHFWTVVGIVEPVLIAALIVASCAAVAAAAQAPQSSGGNTLDLPAYLATLDRCSTAAARLKDHPSEAPALRDFLPDHWQVEVDGQRFAVPADWIRQQLDDFPSERAKASERSGQILGRLYAMRASAAALAEADQRGASGGGARQHLDAILSRKEFGHVRQRSAFQVWLDRVEDWIKSKLESLFGRVRGSKLPSPVFWVLSIILAIGLLAWLIRSVLDASRHGLLPLASGVEAPAGWCLWAGKALAAATGGDYREAMHMAYSAALYRLEESGLWRVDETRTPREYLRLVRGGYDRYGSLEALTFRFERSWYGGQAPSADEFRRAVIELKDLGCPLDWNPATANS